MILFESRHGPFVAVLKVAYHVVARDHAARYLENGPFPQADGSTTSPCNVASDLDGSGDLPPGVFSKKQRSTVIVGGVSGYRPSAQLDDSGRRAEHVAMGSLAFADLAARHDERPLHADSPAAIPPVFVASACGNHPSGQRERSALRHEHGAAAVFRLHIATLRPGDAVGDRPRLEIEGSGLK